MNLLCSQAVPKFVPRLSRVLTTQTGWRPWAGREEMGRSRLASLSQAILRCHKGSQGVTKGDSESQSVVRRLREFHQRLKCVYCQLVVTTPKRISPGVTADQPMHSTIGDSGSNVANIHCQTIAIANVATEYHNQECRKIPS